VVGATSLQDIQDPAVVADPDQAILEDLQPAALRCMEGVAGDGKGLVSHRCADLPA